MSVAKTSIAWCDATWNPIRGCSKVSPGCAHCYAETMAKRFVLAKDGSPLPFLGYAYVGERGWTGKVSLLPEALDWPLRRREPKRIFVSSMSDPFHENLSDSDRDRIMAVMYLAPHHTYLSLTKRAENQRRYMSDPQTPFRVQRAIDALSVDEEMRGRKEEWRPITGTPYEASSFGWIRRGDLVLVQSDHSGDYKQVALSIDGVAKTRLVHRLVLEAFVGPAPTDDSEVAHRNGNRSDNRIANLRWTDKAGNMLDSSRHGTAGVWMKGRATLAPEQVKEIRRLRADGEKLDAIALKFGSTRKRISKVCLGQTYKGAAIQWPPPNLWLGVSVEDRAHLSRLDDLRATPAAHRWVSMEPLLEDLGDIRRFLEPTMRCEKHGPVPQSKWTTFKSCGLCMEEIGDAGRAPLLIRDVQGINALVVGGESGPKARPCDVAWIRSLRDQCVSAGVPLMVKQLGSNVIAKDGLTMCEWARGVQFTGDGHGLYHVHLRDHKGADHSEWPVGLQPFHTRVM